MRISRREFRKKATRMRCKCFSVLLCISGQHQQRHHCAIVIIIRNCATAAAEAQKERMRTMDKRRTVVSKRTTSPEAGISNETQHLSTVLFWVIWMEQTNSVFSRWHCRYPRRWNEEEGTAGIHLFFLLLDDGPGTGVISHFLLLWSSMPVNVVGLGGLLVII